MEDEAKYGNEKPNVADFIVNQNEKSFGVVYYPILFATKQYDKLLAVQTQPNTKFWFKDEEVTEVELIQILERAEKIIVQ